MRLHRMKHLQRSAAASAQAYTRAGTIAQEVLGAIRTVASLGGESRLVELYGSHVKEAERAGIALIEIVIQNLNHGWDP